MNIVFGIGATLVLIFLIFYPAIQFIDHMIFPSSMQHQFAKYKVVAAKMVLNEYLMIETINRQRAILGLDPIPHQPVIEQFKGIGPWSGLKAKCVAIVNDALKKVTSIKVRS